MGRFFGGMEADRDRVKVSMGEPRDWTELLVKAAELLGFNPVRLRWRIHRLREDAARARVVARDKVIELSYAHKACPHCGAVADRDETRCPRCGEALRSKLADRLYRLGLVLPVAWSFGTLLAVAFALVYVRLGMADPQGIVWGFSSETYLRFGALWPPSVLEEPWRLGTAVFLHIGLLHLAFNTMALLQIAPTIEDLWGRWALPGFFLVTGLLANLASLELGLSGLQAGASGGLMGLTGAAAGWGLRERTSLGRDVRNRMLQWAAYTMLFGLFVNADNVAHAGGFVSGLVLGLLVRPEALKRFGRSPAAVPAALLVGLASVGLVALVLAGVGSVPAERELLSGIDELDAAPGRADSFEQLAAPCELLARGEEAEAVARVQSLPGFGHLPGRRLPALCETVERIQEHCARVRSGRWDQVLPAGRSAEEQEETRAWWLQRCAPRP